MTIFITGGTGYIGSYVVDYLLQNTDHRLALLVRAASVDEAEQKLWRGLQMHLDADRFWHSLDRIDFVRGDLTAPGLGIKKKDRKRLLRDCESVLHIAASLNRKSAKACFNANLRGTLSVIELARAIADANGLRRFSHVSTTAVAGHRSHEVVTEDEAIDWARSDYDPYARTKKFSEHMVRTLLPDVSTVVFRPSTVMGDSRHPRTAAFDMTRAFCTLADLPAVPWSGETRQDIANADWVSRAIAAIHVKRSPKHDTYHLSSGVLTSNTSEEIARGLAPAVGRKQRFVPALKKPAELAVNALDALPGRNAVTLTGALLKVFWPYITFDTVFDNSRAVAEIGESPVPFAEYCGPLYRWAKEHRFTYPHLPLPQRPVTVTVPQEIQA
jgi:nucleoside-diphosphate-sugar epimerase